MKLLPLETCQRRLASQVHTDTPIDFTAPTNTMICAGKRRPPCPVQSAAAHGGTLCLAALHVPDWEAPAARPGLRLRAGNPPDYLNGTCTNDSGGPLFDPLGGDAATQIGVVRPALRLHRAWSARGRAWVHVAALAVLPIHAMPLPPAQQVSFGTGECEGAPGRDVALFVAFRSVLPTAPNTHTHTYIPHFTCSCRWLHKCRAAAPLDR